MSEELPKLADGELIAVVWPAYAGAVNDYGQEPMGDPDYDRGQIIWEMNEQGRICGRAKINIPRGARDWTHIIYAHHPTKPVFSTSQKLSHPFHLPDGGTIDLIDITDDDVRPLNPDKVLHD
jgi:hypothetical protein